MSSIVSRATSHAVSEDAGRIFLSTPAAPMMAANQNGAGTHAAISTATVLPAAPVNKRAVAQSFSRAAEQYDQVAHLQMQTGQQLLASIDPSTLTHSASVALDIGCGTGKLTRELRPFCQQLIALDFAPGMLQFARAHHEDRINHFVCADADALPFAPSSLDLVFSNFALQWSASLPRLIAALSTALRPSGQLVFSIPADGTLWELQQSWRQADSHHRHVNAFLAEVDVRTALHHAGFQIESLRIETVVMYYDRVRELTQELKTLGAHTVNGEANRPLTGKAAVARMLEAYERLRQPDGRLPATWKVLHVMARRPS